MLSRRTGRLRTLLDALESDGLAAASEAVAGFDAGDFELLECLPMVAAVAGDAEHDMLARPEATGLEIRLLDGFGQCLPVAV
jgi:hypothetical protein